MPDETTQIVLATLARIEVKMDTQAGEIARVNERLAALETRQATQEEVNRRVQELDKIVTQGLGQKTLAGWLITTVIAVGAYFK